MAGEDSVNVSGFELLNSFGAVLNSDQRNSDYSIACYLIPRLAHIQDVSITQIVDEAYVTRSAVRRFCNRMGFTSFSDLKDSITSALFPSDLNGRDLGQSLASYRSALDSGIRRMFVQMERTIDNDTIDGLARYLCEHQRVLLACAGNTTGVLDRFQQELFFAGKHTEVITAEYEKRLTEISSQDSTLLLVVSASGVFAHSFEYWLRQANADKILITANLELVGWDAFDRVLCLSEDQEGRDSLGIYGKYGISYFFDLLSASYLHNYGAPIEMES